MKSNKGFTLIELLAVIVILAIIALIATPVILGVVEDARKGAAKSSILGYIDAVEKQVMINEMDEKATAIADGTYTIDQLETAGVKVKGDVPNKAYAVTVTVANDVATPTKVQTTGENPTDVVGVVIKGGEVQSTTFVTKDKRYDVTYDKASGKAYVATHSSTNFPEA